MDAILSHDARSVRHRTCEPDRHHLGQLRPARHRHYDQSGQTILTFIAITSLVIPQLVLVIAPVAFVLAVAHILNKLASDSEIIVMNAAGMFPWLLFRAFFSTAVVVSIFILFVSAYLSPECLRILRRWLTDVRADVVANVVQPGRFLTLERGLLFHIRERQPNGVLVGIFVDDHRNPEDATTLLAEQGQIVETGGNSFLILKNGSVQRRRVNTATLPS